MAIVQIITPRMITWDVYNQVQARLDEDGPVEGMIMHTAVDNDGRPKFITVWESEAHAERFGQERIGPALDAIAPDMAGPPEPDQLEVYEIRHMSQS